MNITKHNCESWFLDYYEKNLSPVEVAEVLFFLEEHPELKEVFESYEAVFLEHEKVNFPDKEALKKKYSKEELDIILSSEINIHNCEQFFVAGAEDILSDEQTRRLYSFLAAHPELKKDFDLIQKCKLPAEKISFEHKDLLKKESINAENREEYFVRSIENDLSAFEQKQLASFLQKNPEFKKELELFKDTVLVPEPVSFEFKKELKKREHKPVVIALWSQQRTYFAAAAAVLLLVGLFFFFRSGEENNNYMAGNTDANNTKELNIIPEKENRTSAEKEQATAPQENTALKNEKAPAPVLKNSSINKNSTAVAPANKEEKNSAQPAPVENKGEEPLMANKKEEKKQDEPKIDGPVVAINTEEKKDSAVVAVAPNEAVASAAGLPTEASAQAGAPAKADEYQTVASVVNKRVRSLLGIKQPSTPCETSDKIDLWDLAMAAKRGIQRVIGEKTLDVNKVCDGTGEKVDYVFTAGNFEITKSSSK